MNSTPRTSSIDSLFLSLTGLFVLLYFIVPLFGLDPIWVKSLPPWLLAIWLTLRYGNRTRKAAVALFLSGLGDIMGDLDLFPLQLLFFLAAHLFLIASFLPRFQFDRRSKITLSWVIVYLLLFGTIMLPKIESNLLIGLISLYMLVIATMTFTAMSQKKSNPYLFFWGSLSFILSDSMIAFDRFVEPIPFRTFLVMGTYYLALILLSIAIMDSKKRGRVKNLFLKR